MWLLPVDRLRQQITDLPSGAAPADRFCQCVAADVASSLTTEQLEQLSNGPTNLMADATSNEAFHERFVLLAGCG